MTATATDPFWDQISQTLARAAKARTAEELVAAVGSGPDQHAKDPGARAIFVGSGGNVQLVDVLDDSGAWDITWIENDYWWKATARTNSSTVEYIEGDLYIR